MNIDLLLRKIKYKLSKTTQGSLRFLSTFEVNWGYLGFVFVCTISIILLGVNISRIVRKGYERYEIIQEEKRRLDKLAERNQELKKDLKYYSSVEFVDIKAREELNMAFPNQRLIYIEEEESVDIKDDADQKEENEVKPSWRHWYNLIF